MKYKMNEMSSIIQPPLINLTSTLPFFFAAFISGAKVQVPAPKPKFPLRLPAKFSWLNFSIIKTNGTVQKDQEIYITDRERWRVEKVFHSGQILIAVFDGQSLMGSTLASSNRVVKLDPSEVNQYDPRPPILDLYRTIQELKYNGVDQIGLFRCWCFSSPVNGEDGHIWVDTAKHIPRKVEIKLPDGSLLSEIYLDLPKTITLSPALFQIQNLEVNLIHKVDQKE